MNLHKNNLLNRSAKLFAKPLSLIICNKSILKIFRYIDAYLNFLMGKGSGTGWDMANEISATTGFIQRNDPVIFDVGANIGTWSKQIHDALPEARIFMFEPATSCQEEIRKLSIPRSKLMPMACGNKIGESTLFFSSVHDGAASLHQREDSYFSSRQFDQCKIVETTIDQVRETESIDFIDFVKLDIEGHELFALQGAIKSLKSKKIGAISFEFGSGNINSRTYFRDFWKFLTDLDFKISRVTPCGKLVTINHYYEDLEYFRGVTNYYAVMNKHRST